MLAGQLKKLKTAGMTQPATLIVITAGTRTPGSVSAGTNPTSIEYGCHVAPGTSDEDHIGGTLIEKNDRIYIVPAKLISGGVTPSPIDRLRVDADTLRIVGVGNVGAGAAFICLTRK